MHTIRANELSDVHAIVDHDMHAHRVSELGEASRVIKELRVGHVFLADLDAPGAALRSEGDDVHR